MGHEFEVREEIELAATPEEVWEAIATGPGVDSWFMGRNEFEPREGGTTRQTLLGHTEEAVITAWEPAKRLAYGSAPGEDGTFMAFEYLIEGRDRGSTVLRFVHSGILGDDWEEQYDALKIGDRMYLNKLAAYLAHFPGRTSTYNMFLVGPQAADRDRVWAAFTGAFGLTGTVRAGDRTRLTVAGLPAAEGVVAFEHAPGFLGVCTDEGLYMLLHGYRDTVVAEYHSFSPDVDATAVDHAWQNWLARSFD